MKNGVAVPFLLGGAHHIRHVANGVVVLPTSGLLNLVVVLDQSPAAKFRWDPNLQVLVNKPS